MLLGFVQTCISQFDKTIILLSLTFYTIQQHGYAVAMKYT